MLEAILQSHYFKSLEWLIPGLGLTLVITIVGLFFGFILGAFTGLGSLSKVKFVRWICAVYVEVTRGTPILVQVLFIFLIISDKYVGFNIPGLAAAILAITLNAGAYIAEIVRGAVHSIDKGQHEAGRSIGLTQKQTMRYIIWPQALKRMIPPLGNQFIISLKDTSLFSVIAVHELLYMGKQYYNVTYAYFQTLIMVCILYLLVTIPTSIILRKIERKLDV